MAECELCTGVSAQMADLTCAECGRVASPFAGRLAPPVSLAEQVRALLPHIPDAERVPFLAGMRFAEGFAEYGNGLFTITDEKLAYERDCEAADVYVMDAEKRRRENA